MARNAQQNRTDEQQEEIETESQEIENEPVAFAEFTSKDGWEENHVDSFSVMAISEAFEAKNAVNLSKDDLNGHIVKLKTKTEDLFAIADSGSPMCLINKKTDRRLQENDKSTIFKKAQRKTPLEIWRATMVKP